MRLLHWFVPAVAILTAGPCSAHAADFGDPLTGLSAEQTADFEEGRAAFSSIESAADGLGPVFNEAACSSCHNVGATGGGSTRLETRFGKTDKNGGFNPMENRGGSLMQDHALGKLSPGCKFKPEHVPENAEVQAQRRTTPLFGLGLVDALPESALRSLATNQRANTPRIAGVVSIVPDLSSGRTAAGKFGWKAQNPSLFQFSGDAYLNEMGITSPQFPNENCPEGKCERLQSCNPVPDLNDDGDDVVAFTNFMTLLAPPPRGPVGAAVTAGERVFETAGCGGCHVSTLQTGSSSIAALNQVVFHPYSDFLLHDMGNLGDGITQNNATGRLMRTAPLWGLRLVTRFLHDGRAASVAAAIQAHAGQGAAARDAFAALSASDRDKLLAFLNSL